jgi:3-oxoacyl-(acyl-carrier-protein) synthase
VKIRAIRSDFGQLCYLVGCDEPVDEEGSNYFAETGTASNKTEMLT